MTPSEAIREARRLAGISQEELARRLGQKRPATISAYEVGRISPGAVALTKILDACGVSGGWDAQNGWFVCRPDKIVP
jgi:transcriptional regulator with XRE-family HTH domain